MRVLLMTMLALSAAGSKAHDMAPPPSDLPLALQAAMAEAMPAKLAVSEYWFSRKEWPVDLKDTAYKPWVVTTLGTQGVITLTLQGLTPLAGKSIQLTPGLTEDGVIEWKCASRDIDADQLPETCRP